MAGFLFDDADGLVDREALTVGPVAGHGVEGVGHGDDGGVQGDGVALDVVGVALAVIALMVVQDGVLDVAVEVDVLDDLGADHGMLFDEGTLLRVQLGRLVEDGVVDADLADVVEQGLDADGVDVVGGKMHLLGDQGAVLLHPLGVADGVAVLGLDGGRQGVDQHVLLMLDLQVVFEGVAGQQQRQHEQQHQVQAVVELVQPGQEIADGGGAQDVGDELHEAGDQRGLDGHAHLEVQQERHQQGVDDHGHHDVAEDRQQAAGQRGVAGIAAQGGEGQPRADDGQHDVGDVEAGLDGLGVVHAGEFALVARHRHEDQRSGEHIQSPGGHVALGQEDHQDADEGHVDGRLVADVQRQAAAQHQQQRQYQDLERVGSHEPGEETPAQVDAGRQSQHRYRYRVNDGLLFHDGLLLASVALLMIVNYSAITSKGRKHHWTAA